MIKVDINWGTHLPVLIKLMSITDGDVLELGTGLYSTPFLHWACFPTKRKLVSCENSERFMQRISNCQTDFHDIHLVENWDDFPMEKNWDIVFVDHGPSARRAIDIKRVANYAKYVVLHDSEPEKVRRYGYKDALNSFKYRFDYIDCKPNTTVLSNFVDLTNFKV